jgi:hypothetical protein
MSFACSHGTGDALSSGSGRIESNQANRYLRKMRTILAKADACFERKPLVVSRGFDIAATISNELAIARCPRPAIGSLR